MSRQQKMEIEAMNPSNIMSAKIDHWDRFYAAADRPAAALAQYIHSMDFEQLPPSAIDGAVALIEDNIGCALGALAMAETKPFLMLSDTRRSSGIAVAIGCGQTSVESAVFTNSSLANWLDFDDMHHYFLPYHLGSLIVPAALAVGQSVEASGREFLTAVAAAYEVTMRLGRSLGSGLWKGGLPGLFTSLAQLGPAVAAGKLYGLNAAQMRALFSIVAMEEGGGSPGQVKHDVPASLYVPPLKSNYGTLAQLGIWAAIKARAGVTGRPGLLEYTLTDWYRAGLPSAGYESLVAGLGQEYLIARMSLKSTPSCWLSQAPITALRNALAGRHLDAGQVSKICILGVPRLERSNWSTMLEAQFSMPCAVALATSGIEPGPKWYSDGAYKSQGILDLAVKVVQEADPATELAELRDSRISCRVEIALKDGRILEGACEAIKGTPENPFTWEEREAKWAANAAHLPKSLQAEIRTVIHQIARSKTLGELSVVLAKVSDYTLNSPTR